MNDPTQLPTDAGTYALCLSLDRRRTVPVGRVGDVTFEPGAYVYLGSAHGQGGLRARVRRHLRGGSARHWHVDYLRAVARVFGVCYATTDVPLECVWAQTLTALPDADVPVPGFGASDCSAGCEAHLVALPATTAPAQIRASLARVTDHIAVHAVARGAARSSSAIQH